MKDGVIIINAARGGIINEEAMLEALDTDKVTGAGFDVWSQEPPDTEILKKLIGHEKMVVTPHLGANTFEAQVNVAVDVSREIIHFLDEQPIENAINIPRFDAALMGQMRPYLNLMNVLSDFIIQLVDTNLNKITFSYTGNIAQNDCTPITVLGLAALLNRRVEQDVNMVNAQLVANSMGIVVDEVKSSQSEAFSNMITISIEGPGEKRLVSGTLFEGVPRIVKLRDYQMDFRPEEHMLLLAYGDRPGIIGKIGTILGEHDINIASMNLGRREKKGEAMVILSLDSAVPPDVMEQVKIATEATFIKPLYLVTAK
jgi:D-3-phosphoglycerate dehydrogenase / 2-oxoglutarate reductase